MMQSTSRLTTGRRIGTLALALLAGSLLAACSHLPSTESASQTGKQAAGTARNEVAEAVASTRQQAERKAMRTVSTVTMSCVPTKDGQAAGLHHTEEVEAIYRVAADDKLDDSEVELRFANRSYVLQQAPAASGSRYVTTEPLAKAHRGFSWHTKRNEAIIAAVESGSGVEDVVDGPLLYRCLAAN